MVIVAGLSAIAPDISAQTNKGRSGADRKQRMMSEWHNDMAEFRARSEQDRQLMALTDSLAAVQASAAFRNQDFVLEAGSVQFKNGTSVFVNSNTNFISVKGNRAVVQISPNYSAGGPNGLGGVTVDGMISGQSVRTDRNGNTTLTMSVMGLGINAQVEIYMNKGSNEATATVYPNFNSNTVWLKGRIVPYEQSKTFEGSTL